MTERRIYLKEWRKHRGLTQARVVERLDEIDDPLIPRTTASLSRLENGSQPYSQRILEALADVYQTQPEYLIGRNPEKEGDLLDFIRPFNERQREKAIKVLSAALEDDVELEDDADTA